ncbi:hypothetical protein I3843_14G083900 [Carya illinoinensis]|nr:hypothetical protein I3843_14G083900 [Carya illinoinensis]
MSTTDESKRALKAITALKEEMKKLNKLLDPKSDQKTLENLIKSLDAPPNANQRDSLGAGLSMRSSPSPATSVVHQAVPKSVDKVVNMLEEAVKALETLNGHLQRARDIKK